MEEIEKDHKGAPLGVTVLTTVGMFPSEDDYRRAHENETIQKLLDEVKKAQSLKDTSEWVLRLEPGHRDINPDKTFKEEQLSCVIALEWHKREGGGGA